MLIAGKGNISYEYPFWLKPFLKGNPIENRPITQYIRMRDAAFAISFLGIASDIDMESEEEKGLRGKAAFDSLPEHIKEKLK